MKYFKFEIQYRAKRPDTYIYFAIVFLFSLVAVNFVFEGYNLGLVKENAPYVIAYTMAAVSAIFMMITSMIMGVAVLRDYDHNMESLMFVNPIKKGDYLLGRFLGSWVVLIFIFSGLLWGVLLGELMPWRDTDMMLPFNFWYYLQPFLYLVLPTLFFGGAIFFVSGALSRKLMVVYTQGILFFIVLILARRIEDKFFEAILDPFSLYTVDVMAQFWTVAERNSLMVPMEGVLLYNRLIWVVTGIVALIIGYYGFSFNVVRDNAYKKHIKVAEDDKNRLSHDNVKIPANTQYLGIKANIIQLKHHSLFYFKSILKEVSFWAIVICGMVIIFINSIGLGTSYGVNSHPTTYLIVEQLQEMSIYFFLIILVFYSGQLVWKERDTKLDLIYDPLPMSDFINLTGKFAGLLLTYMVLILALILSGVIFQTINGYYHYDPGVYFNGFFLEILPFLILFTFISFFFQIIANHKFIGHTMVMIFFIATMALKLLGFDHGLYKFGGGNLGTYSDINGYGHFLLSYSWFKIYWLSFSIILFVIAVVFSVRGTETGVKNRWKLSKQRLTSPLIGLGAAAILIFTLSGCYIFYNTNILNKYSSAATQKTYRADYEKTLKKYEYLPQPKIVDVNLKVDLYPYNRDYTVEGYFILTNKLDEAINEIYVQKLPNYQVKLESVKFEGGAVVNNEYEQQSYYSYELNRPLQPGDSIKMEFKQTFITRGFVERSVNTHIVYNGTFLSNDHFPALGYNNFYELSNINDREEYGLAPRIISAKRDDPREVINGRAGDDGYEINFEMVVGTDSDQIVIAPGYLQKEWTEGSRKYFQYKMDKPMINFYSIVSARYEVMQDKWTPLHDSLGKPVDLEIYYHKGHEYNLERMMASMKMSLDYFSRNFSPYQYRQMRIVEFPRYAKSAQSFPNTVAYSEAIGFIMDIDDKKDVDMPFFITAHELAHQWWGLQVVAANVQGRGMILESLAQYSALMVMKQMYPEEKIQQFLRMQLNFYLEGRTAEKKHEMPLALVEKHKYIHYGKGAINFYTLQDYISEDSVNLAIRRFIRDWNSFDGLLQTDRYATTADLLIYFSEVTPDSMQYIIEDMFETITLYENKTTETTYHVNVDSTYTVNIEVEAIKYRSDSLGNEESIALNDYIDIGIYGMDEEGEEVLIYLEKHFIDKKVNSFEVTVDRKPTMVGIDPIHKLIDRNPEDNVKDLEEEPSNLASDVLPTF